METYPGLSSVFLARNGVRSSQKKEQRRKPGACENTYAWVNVLAFGQTESWDMEALSPFVYLWVQDLISDPYSEEWTKALGFLSGIYLLDR